MPDVHNNTQFFVDDAGLTNLMAVQNGFTSVLVNWTEPRNFSGWYQIMTIPNTATTISARPPQNIVISTPGVYTIRLLFRRGSEEFPRFEVTGVRVLGKDNHESYS